MNFCFSCVFGCGPACLNSVLSLLRFHSCLRISVVYFLPFFLRPKIFFVFAYENVCKTHENVMRDQKFVSNYLNMNEF